MSPRPDRVAPMWRRPGFAWLLGYRLGSLLSYQIVAVAVGWHLYQLTGSTFALGLVGLAEVLPYFLVAPFAGYLVDILPRRRLGIAACGGLALTALVLVGLTAGHLADRATWPIYAAIALTGMVRAFLSPVYNALFARVLPREDYSRGAGVGTVAFQAALVLGPALGGGLVALGGTLAAYGVAAFCALAALLAVARLRVEEPIAPAVRPPIFASIAEGAGFVWQTPVMLGAMALDMFSVLLGGVIALLPAFIADILAAGPEALGLLRATPAIGSILVGLWLARHPLRRQAGVILLLAVAGFGLSILGFAVSTQLWASALCLFFYGAFDGVSVVLRQTILQLATPDAMRGRVSSINGLFISSSNELGAFYGGSMARLLGLVPAMLLGGSAVIGVAALTAWRNPALRRLDLRQLG